MNASTDKPNRIMAARNRHRSSKLNAMSQNLGFSANNEQKELKKIVTLNNYGVEFKIVSQIISKMHDFVAQPPIFYRNFEIFFFEDAIVSKRKVRNTL